MPLRRNQWGWVFWAVLGLTALSGCLEEPGSEYYLRLRLNDSLANYDSVEIVLVSSSDTSNVLATVHNGPLPNPRGIAPYRLPDGLTEAQFEVRVRAYIYEGQLGLETRITKSGSNLSVTHSPIIPLPQPYLTTLRSLEVFTAGFLIPPFDSGITDYEALVPVNFDSAQLYPALADTRASAYFGTDTVPFSPPAPNFPTSFVPLQVDITVKNRGRQKVYHIRLKRDPRAGPHLTAFKTSPNNWTPAFHRDSMFHYMTVATTDSLLRFDSLQADPFADVILNNRDTILASDLLSGTLPSPQPLAFGSNVFTLKLYKWGAEQVYTFTVTREYPPRLLSFRTTPNFWSPAFQPEGFLYIMSSNGVSQIVFDSVVAAPGFNAFIQHRLTSGFVKIDSGTVPSPYNTVPVNDTIRIRISKTGLTNPPVYLFTLTP